MEYKSINDNELLYLVADNNDEYRNIIFEKYKPIIFAMAREYIKINKDPSISVDDLIQVGYLGLNTAIKFYDPKGCLFYTYACLCIRSSLNKEIYHRNSKINKSNHVFIPYDEDLLKEQNGILMDYEHIPTKDLFLRIKYNLNFFDSSVFELRISGFSYKEIALLLDVSVNKVDYSIQKTRHKLKKVL